MIAIIDRTLSCVNPVGTADELRDLMTSMFACGVNILEITEEMYHRLAGELPSAGKYILRLSHVEDAGKYPGVHRFVATGTTIGNMTFSEEYFFRAEDLTGEFVLSPHLRPVRLNVRVRAGGEDQETVFACLHRNYIGHIECSPQGDPGVATALACEWLTSGGNTVVTTQNAIGGYASFEETVRYLNVVRRRRPALDSVQISALHTRLAEMTGKEEFLHPHRGLPTVGPAASCYLVKYLLESAGLSTTSEKLKLFTARLRKEALARGSALSASELASCFLSFAKLGNGH